MANATIYHKQLIWPGTFVVIGAITPKDVKELGANYGALTDNEADGLIDSVIAFKSPHPLLVDLILELPDEDWIAACEHQSSLMGGNNIYSNMKIIDKGYDGYNMMVFKYIADVDLEAFRKSMDSSIEELTSDPTWFKIIRRIP